MIIGIDYSGGNKNPIMYRGVTLSGATHGKHRYYSGDVVEDFNEAIRYVDSVGSRVTFSSSVDQFLMDSDYSWDETSSRPRLVAPDPVGEFIDTLFEGDDHSQDIVPYAHVVTQLGNMVEENTTLHNLMNGLVNNSISPSEACDYYQEIADARSQDAIYLPKCLMALQLIEAINAGIGNLSDAERSAASFRYAHVALGMCDDDHEEWLSELTREYRRLILRRQGRNE